MTETIDQKYIAAFEGILTADELARAATEPGEFSRDLPPLKHVPGLVRHTIGWLPENAKLGLIASGVKAADKQGRNLSDVVGNVFDPTTHKSYQNQPDTDDKQDYTTKLNYQSFVLSDDGNKLQRTSAQQISELFPKGEKDSWPTLVLVSNSNLASPQLFFDSFQAAQQVIPAVTDTADNIVVTGAYFSQRHLHANALDTQTRYRELGLNPQSMEKLSPAAEIQAYQLLDLLLERDASGAVMTADNKPVLRADAAEVLKHVVGYGYSAAHMTNKDAFRALRDVLTSGDVQVQVREDGELITREASAADATRLISNARLIGVAGLDAMAIGQEKGMPREVDFVSPNDFSMSLNGPKFFNAPNVIALSPKGVDGRTIGDAIGGHAQATYVEALLGSTNSAQREQAQAKLNSTGVGIGGG